MSSPPNPSQDRLREGEEWHPRMIEIHAHNPNLHWIAEHALTPPFECTDHRFPKWLASLTPGQRMIVSTPKIENHVNQGGFGKLWIYDPWALCPAIEGFRLIGAEKLALLLETVARAADWSAYSNVDEEDGYPPTDFDNAYYELDTTLTPHGYDLGKLKCAFILAHPDQFPRC